MVLTEDQAVADMANMLVTVELLEAETEELMERAEVLEVVS